MDKKTQAVLKPLTWCVDGNPEALYALGVCAQQLGNPDARRRFQAALEVAPDFVAARAALTALR